MTLFGRSYLLQLGRATIDGRKDINNALRITFEIERSLTKQANTGKVNVYNLSEDTREAVREERTAVSLSVGLGDEFSEIFSGTLISGTTSREGADFVTSFEQSDGGPNLSRKRINVGFKGPVSVETITNRLAEELGLGLGNLKEKLAGGAPRKALQEFANGKVLSGPVSIELDKLAGVLGFEWSVQGGQLQFLEPGGAVRTNDIVVLSKSTGLVGLPQPGEKGVVEARSLLIPSLLPGRLVEIRAEVLSGTYRVDRVVFTGDSRGNEWYAGLELSPR